MSCCGDKCNCGSSCSCSSCGKMYPDMEIDPTATFIYHPVKRSTMESDEQSFGAEGSANDGCKCGSSCHCGDDCKC